MNTERLFHILSTPRGYNSVTEHEFLLYLKNQLVNSEWDAYGNLWVSLGDSTTLFTCHTDTVHKQVTPIKTELDKGGIITSGSKCPLGADDGAGIWLLMEMIEAGVPGTYVFYRGEEQGCIGSNSSATKEPDKYSKFKRAIAFDRKGISDVITHQLFARCCSEVFAIALSNQLNKHTHQEGLFEPSSKGVFTDTSSLTHLVPECTNISCGYYLEHTPAEKLDFNFLVRLRDAVISVDWESLPTVRIPEIQIKDDNLFEYVSAMSQQDLDEWVFSEPEAASELLYKLLKEPNNEQNSWKYSLRA